MTTGWLNKTIPKLLITPQEEREGNAQEEVKNREECCGRWGIVVKGVYRERGWGRNLFFGGGDFSPQQGIDGYRTSGKSWNTAVE